KDVEIFIAERRYIFFDGAGDLIDEFPANVIDHIGCKVVGRYAHRFLSDESDRSLGHVDGDDETPLVAAAVEDMQRFTLVIDALLFGNRDLMRPLAAEVDHFAERLDHLIEDAYIEGTVAEHRAAEIGFAFLFLIGTVSEGDEKIIVLVLEF